jgi:ParB-like chromosome segregation protein Spo0J
MEEIRNFEIEMVDVDYIKLDPTNPNEMQKEKMEALRKIMKEKGMLQPILIDQDSLMIDGEHRYIIYKEFGMQKIPCFRMNVTDSERRLLRQTMNKIRGEHNPRDDVEDLIRLSKEMGVQQLSSYLGQEEKELSDYLNSINQVPESYLSMLVDEKKNTKRMVFISFKLTDEQAKKLIEEMGTSSIKDIVLMPVSGLLVDNLGRN